jgi:hypothetical protein
MGMAPTEKMQRIFIAAITLISLLASSVSACTCSHHQERAKVEASSCHSHSHNESTLEIQNNATSQSVQSPCECILVKPAPAIIAKSDKRKSALQPDAVLSETRVPSFEREIVIAAVLPGVEIDQSAYPSKRPSGLVPSRAPPRL